MPEDTPKTYQVASGNLSLPLVIDSNGSRWTPVRFYTDSLGLNFGSQMDLLNEHVEMWCHRYLIFNGSPTPCLPLDTFPGWIAGLDIKKVHPRVQGSLILLRATAASALRVFQPEPPPKGELITVDFHGASLILVEKDGQPFTAMKPVVEGMGLDWGGQHKKLTSEARWGCISFKGIQLPGDSQRRELVVMPLRKLPGWLMTLQPSRVRPEIREKVVQYQNECDDALWAYWTKGHATNPRLVADADVIREMREMVEEAAKVRTELVSLTARTKKAESKINETRELKEKRLLANLVARVIKDPLQRHQAIHAILPTIIPAPRTQGGNPRPLDFESRS